MLQWSWLVDEAMSHDDWSVTPEHDHVSLKLSMVFCSFHRLRVSEALSPILSIFENHCYCYLPTVFEFSYLFLSLLPVYHFLSEAPAEGERLHWLSYPGVDIAAPWPSHRDEIAE